MSYSTYVINGTCFWTIDSEKSTQDSGISLEVEIISRDNATSSSQVVKQMSLANRTNGVKIEDESTLLNLHHRQSQFESHLERRYICKEGDPNKIDVLEWWKVNTLKYCILTRMACDILVIRITTVASKATFNVAVEC
ncbi:hypothetical protein Patl1_18542 [Pistacia atlantica]|uniref:Uncharacterized protein n=1 Tax=Pistacia atlantica TaxID=434234 RepID=A0ACC1C068_9ROSI|nr:hypothetical protein Patl1_18542 [Pistacia atlantica]